LRITEVKQLQTELQSRLFLYVPYQNAAFYQEPFAGWEKVISAFSTVTDLPCLLSFKPFTPCPMTGNLIS
jgi:hypothetical protein